jgi:hypothetical protein
VCVLVMTSVALGGEVAVAAFGAAPATASAPPATAASAHAMNLRRWDAGAAIGEPPIIRRMGGQDSATGAV